MSVFQSMDTIQAIPNRNDAPSLDLNLLRALVVLLEEGSVTRAAARLGVGQPAVSKQLEKLRASLGDPLLVRRGNALVPTERGRALFDVARAALHSAVGVLAPEPHFDPRSARGVVRIALADDVTLALAPPIMHLLRERAPSLDLRVRPIRLDLGEALARGTVDMAVIPDVRAFALPMPDLSPYVLVPLLRERFVVVSRQRRRWTLDSYATASHVLAVPSGDDDRGLMDVMLARRGQRRRVALTVPSFHHAVCVAAETDLVATLPERSARVAAQGLPVHLSAPPLALPDFPMLLGWHPSATASARHRFLRALVKEAAQATAEVRRRADSRRSSAFSGSKPRG